MPDEKTPEQEWREGLQAQLGEAFKIVGQQNAEMNARMAQLAKEVEAARTPARQQATGLSREELSKRALDEFVSDTAGFFENLGHANRKLIEDGVTKKLAERDAMEQQQAQHRIFWDQFYQVNQDMGAWQGELEREWMALGNYADPSERANEAANRVRQKVAQAQATAIEMKKREDNERRMASSSPVQVGWQKLFEPSQQGSAPVVNPQAEAMDWVNEQRELHKKRTHGIQWDKVPSGVRG